jgi:predicted DNA-binding transcriptional regulator YafY
METVQRAVKARRKLAFNYISPEHPDGQPRYHVVAPHRLRWRQGHLYLYAYDLLARGPGGEEWLDGGARRFRLSRILEDGHLAVLAEVLPPTQRRPPRYRVRYRLLGPLSRGSISRHFLDMAVTRLPDGSAEVNGFTEDVFEAARTLLGYGENCIVLGGEEVLARVERALRGMARNYGLVD